MVFSFEVMDTQQRIPTDTYINARLKAVFTAGIYKIADYISFAVFPRAMYTLW